MSTKEFPRVEQDLFPDMKGRPGLCLLSVGWDEDKVVQLTEEAVGIFERNIVGPLSYVQLYGKYEILLNGQAIRDRDSFLLSHASLDEFRVNISASEK